MDGVLVNNTQAHVKAFEIFCERYGVEDWQHKLQTAFGMGNDDIMRLILPEEIIREKGMKALGEEKEAIYREVYAPEIRPVRGLVELLEELRRRGIRCAVGSSGCRENVDFVHSNCGITDYFSCIVSGDRVTRCKPDPEIYLLAAEGLHLPSAECLVFEDARVGITAARRAGAGRIVALATTLPRHTLATQTEADVVIDDFASITDLDALLRGPLYAGLPTLEAHRTAAPSAAFADLALNYGLDGIFAGDPEVSTREQEYIRHFCTTGELCLPVALRPGYETLYDRTFTCRPDSPKGLVRYQESRLYSCFGSTVQPDNCVERRRRCVTMDNIGYGRYSGEIQLVRADLPADEKVNVIGEVPAEYDLLLDCIKRGKTFRMVKTS